MKNYHIITFGCQMNRSDSERIATVLELVGLSPATKIESADLIVINSCSVRQSAINRIFGLLNNLKKKQKLHSCHPERSEGSPANAGRNCTYNNHGISASGGSAEGMTSSSRQRIQNVNLKQIKTILTGCVLDTDKRKLADKFDLIIDIKELTQKPKNLINFLRLQDQEFKAFDYTDYFKINPQYRSKFSAYIPIMTGCNNFCAYCAVPYTRGREISRPVEEIINEIKILVEKGYKEITLLGQNVNSYKSEITNYKLQITNKSQNSNSKTKKGIINFPKLLKLINDIPGKFWIRFLTSHPKDMSDKLIKTMVKCEKVTEYVHLPIQSGDDEILNKMNRHYTKQQYLELIDKIKMAYAAGANRKLSLPVAISTDIIVGFPGETKKQFQNTAKIMRHVKFDMAYLSEYSPRTGTVAAKMPDTVSIAEKKRRKEFLNEILRKTALANNKKYFRKTVDVLIEKTDTDFAYGKTRTFKNVRIMPYLKQIDNTVGTGRDLSLQNGKIKPGQFARIKISKANAWNLEGKIAE